VAVAQSVELARGLRATKFVFDQLKEAEMSEACIKNENKVYRSLVGKLGVKRLLRKPGRLSKVNIGTDLTVIE
jgi:hypothetical protein